MPKLEVIEDEISRKLAAAEQSGELRAAPSFGKPFSASEGWDETPDEFKMAFKMLKDSGFVPPEIAAFHERARLRAHMNTCDDYADRQRTAAELSALEQLITLRLEDMRASGNL
jgi:Domain of unknown function (DUF1992)